MKPTCQECGSSDVKADAWAEWSEEKNDWVLSDIFPGSAVCEKCGGECSLEWDEEPEGQDRESYSDDQDRESYSTEG